MASVHLMCSSLLRQDPMIPWEAWFTVLLPCFYRAWLCQWSWWRPQPQVTEFSGTAADLQCRLKSLGHTHDFLTCSWKGLSEAPAELSQSSSSSPHEKESYYSPNFSHLTSPSKKPFEDVRTMGKLTCGWWMRMRQGRKKEWFQVMLLELFTANHTQDWFTAHSALLTHFSCHTFHCPISLLHQGQMKGTMACTPHSDLLELHSLTHLLWGVNGLLKLPFMKMGLLR